MTRLLALLALLAAVSVATPNAAATEAEPTVRITNGEWPPFLGEHLPDYGTVSELITRSFEQIGYKVEYGFFPWKRSLVMVERKQWDAAAVWRKTPEREAAFYLSDPVMHQKYALFYLKESPLKFNSLNDLKGQQVGVARGYDYGKDFQDRMLAKEFEPSENDSDLVLLKTILGRRIAVAPIHYDVGMALLKAEFAEDERNRFAVSTFTFEEAPLFLLFARTERNKALVEKFNRSLAQLKKKAQ